MATYQEAFLWDGHQLLMDRFEQVLGTNSLLNDVLNFYSSRLIAEESCARELSKLNSKYFKSQGTEKGTVVDSWAALLKEHEERGRLSSDLKEHLVHEVSKLEGLRKDLQKQKETTTQTLQKIVKDLEKAKLDLAKTKMKFHTALEQSETVQSSLEKAKVDGTMSNKQLTKLNLHVIKIQSEYNRAEEEHQAEQKKFLLFQQENEKKIADLLKEFQALDELRLSSIRASIEHYTVLSSKTAVKISRNHEAVTKAVQSSNEHQDMENFITETKPHWKPSGTTPRTIEKAIAFSSSSDIGRSASPRRDVTRTSSVVRGIAAKKDHKSDKKSKKRQVRSSTESDPRKLTWSDDIQVALIEGDEGSTTNQPRKCRVQYDYFATEEGEINLKTGDIITLLRVDPSGWCEGETKSGARGLFPANYVSLLDTGKRYKALYDYPGHSEDDLPLTKGESVVVEGRIGDWCLGYNDQGRVGIFPLSFVEPCSSPRGSDSTDTSPLTTPTSAAAKPTTPRSSSSPSALAAAISPRSASSNPPVALTLGTDRLSPSSPPSRALPTSPLALSTSASDLVKPTTPRGTPRGVSANNHQTNY